PAPDLDVPDHCARPDRARNDDDVVRQSVADVRRENDGRTPLVERGPTQAFEDAVCRAATEVVEPSLIFCAAFCATASTACFRCTASFCRTWSNAFMP